MKTSELERWLDTHEVRMVRTEGASIDGLSLGKHLSRDKFLRSLPLGPAISDAVLGIDVGGGVNIGVLGNFSAGFLGDVHQRPDLATMARLPNRPGTATCIVELVDVEGEPIPLCSRVLLRRMQAELESRGYRAKFAFELEAMLFEESFAEARAKGYRDLAGIGVPVAAGYLNPSAHLQAPFMEEVTRRLEGMRIGWEAWNGEMSLGQVELNLPPSSPLEAADAAQRCRQVFREVAYDLGHSVTFMAKPTEKVGNGLHIHHSLLRDGEPVFYDPVAQGPSKLMRHWMAGLLATMDGAVSLLVPTVNAFRRMVDFAGCPTTATWGEENKSTALRVISRDPRVARIEHRLGSGELNPYVAAATLLAGGMVGLDRALEPRAATDVMAWGPNEAEARLPNTLPSAADALECNEALSEMLGPEFVRYWLATRRWEWEQYAKAVGTSGTEDTDVSRWELVRHFELC